MQAIRSITYSSEVTKFERRSKSFDRIFKANVSIHVRVDLCDFIQTLYSLTRGRMIVQMILLADPKGKVRYVSEE